MSHHKSQAISFHPSMTGTSVLGLVMLVAAGWMMRKQVAHLGAPLVKQVSEVSRNPWMKSLLSWVHSCPYSISLTKRAPSP